MKKKFLNSSINLIKANKKCTEEELEIISYGLESIYLVVTKAIIIFTIAIILGITKEVLLLLIFYNIIRTQAFGIHASKSIYCLISSIIFFIGGALFCKLINISYKITMITALICNFCILLYAPADTYKRPLINKKKRIAFKYKSILLGFLYIITLYILRDNDLKNFILIGMVESTLMILPITYKIFKLPYNNYKNYNYNVWLIFKYLINIKHKKKN